MQRLRALWTLVLVALLAPLTQAQGGPGEHVKAHLYTRVAGSAIDAALEVEIDPSWHLYHTELGHPDAVGMPSRLTLGGTGITWDAATWPEPERFDQSDFGAGVFILGHEGTFVIRAHGTLAAGADGKDASAHLVGQTCDPSMCLPVDLTVKTEGPGPDALFAAGAGGGAAAAPAEPVPAKDEIENGKANATLYTRVVDGKVQAVLQIAIQRGYHLYGEEIGHTDTATPTVVTLKGAGVTWGPVAFPEPHKEMQGFDYQGTPAWAWVHDGDIALHAWGTLAPGATGEGLWGKIKGQTCNDSGCVPYAETFVSQGKGPDDLFAWFADHPAGSAGPGSGGAGIVVAASSGSSGGAAGSTSLWLFLLSCIGGGLFTLLMPCTYPMIPITISFFTKQAHEREGRLLGLSLAYGLGIVLVFVLVGVLVGPAIITFATHWLTNLVIGAAFLYFALGLFGVVTITPPRFLMNVAGRAQGKGGLGGVFLMGATLVITSFTCTAPIVGGILGLGAVAGNMPRIALGMGVFGLTVAIPFVILSLIPGRLAAMPRAGQWMNTLKFYLGFVEVAASMKFLSNVDVAFNEGPRWLPYTPFLVIWGVVFAAAGLYLLKVLRFKDPRGAPRPTRIAFGALTLAFAAYCFWGAAGKPLDATMLAFAPPQGKVSWELVLDDFDTAVAKARKEHKLVLTNFTGVT